MSEDEDDDMDSSDEFVEDESGYNSSDGEGDIDESITFQKIEFASYIESVTDEKKQKELKKVTKIVALM